MSVPQSLLPKENLWDLRNLAASTPLGCFVEVGVYKGGSAYQLYEVAALKGRQLHLFDTFTGIPEKTAIDVCKIGEFKDVSAEAVQAAMPDAHLHIGIFPGTLTDEVKDIAFTHIDCDQHETCKLAIKLLWERTISGGIMAFDDYPLPGIRKAIDEQLPNIRFSLYGVPYAVKQWNKNIYKLI